MGSPERCGNVTKPLFITSEGTKSNGVGCCFVCFWKVKVCNVGPTNVASINGKSMPWLLNKKLKSSLIYKFKSDPIGTDGLLVLPQ